MEGTREVHNSVVIKLTMSSKNITRFVRATRFLETNDKNGRCLNQWTVFLAANQPQNLEWLTWCQAVLKRKKRFPKWHILMMATKPLAVWLMFHSHSLQWRWKRSSNSLRKEQMYKDNRHKPGEELKYCKQRWDRTCFYAAFYLNKRSGIY